jgi:hypothetical protein
MSFLFLFFTSHPHTIHLPISFPFSYHRKTANLLPKRDKDERRREEKELKGDVRETREENDEKGRRQERSDTIL